VSLLKPVTNGVQTQGWGSTGVLYEYGYWGNATKAAFGSEPGLSYYPHFHPAIDLAAPLGTPILAAQTGTVVYSGWALNPGPEAGGGIVVDVDIGTGFHYVNCHCNATLVRVGQKVSKGQQVATVGQTGSATGPHDHFQVYDHEYSQITFYNPLLFLPGGSLANDSRVNPVVAPTKACIPSAGVNIRTAPKLASYYLYRTTTSTYLTCAQITFAFGGFVTGDGYVVNGKSGNQWGRIWLNGAYRYVARPFLKLL